jgi:hypothetical protein
MKLKGIPLTLVLVLAGLLTESPAGAIEHELGVIDGPGPAPGPAFPIHTNGDGVFSDTLRFRLIRDTVLSFEVPPYSKPYPVLDPHGADLRFVDEHGIVVPMDRDRNGYRSERIFPAGAYRIGITGRVADEKRRASYALRAISVPTPEPDAWTLIILVLGAVLFQIRSTSRFETFVPLPKLDALMAHRAHQQRTIKRYRYGAAGNSERGRDKTEIALGGH